MRLGTLRMATAKSSFWFEWLRGECGLIKSRRFHIFHPGGVGDTTYELDWQTTFLNGPYAEYIAEFGWSHLFTDHRDAPSLSIHPLKSHRRVILSARQVFVCFADLGQQTFAFKEDDVRRGNPVDVYQVKGRSSQLVDRFPAWLHMSYDKVKSKFSARQWGKIVAGPPPFDARDSEIVAARGLYRWSLKGFAANGDAKFEVFNDSKMTLPFLSIGVRDVAQRILTGGVWLDVSRIAPGKSGVVLKDCYKDLIPNDELEIFEKPVPIPEKKEAYWEFGVPA